MSDPRTIKFPGSGPMPETLQAARGCWVPRPFEALHPDERSDTYMNRYEPTHQSSVNKNVAVVSRREPSMVQQENQGLRCLMDSGYSLVSDLFFWPFFPRRSFGVASLANLVAAKVVISTSICQVWGPVIPVAKKTLTSHFFSTKKETATRLQPLQVQSGGGPARQLSIHFCFFSSLLGLKYFSRSFCSPLSALSAAWINSLGWGHGTAMGLANRGFKKEEVALSLAIQTHPQIVGFILGFTGFTTFVPLNLLKTGIWQAAYFGLETGTSLLGCHPCRLQTPLHRRVGISHPSSWDFRPNAKTPEAQRNSQCMNVNVSN